MKTDLFCKIIYDYFRFFWRQCKRERIIRVLPVYEIQENRFHAAAVILDSRQAGIDIAKYLYRLVARNGILMRSQRKVGAGNKDAFLMLDFFLKLKK